MFVYPHAQAKGIGAALMEVIKGELESLGIGTIILFTSKDFFPFEFYLKSGFREMEGMRMMHFANDV
jgi:GNAT superfamily N-acetyltransferase